MYTYIFPLCMCMWMCMYMYMTCTCTGSCCWRVARMTSSLVQYYYYEKPLNILTQVVTISLCTWIYIHMYMHAQCVSFQYDTTYGSSEGGLPDKQCDVRGFRWWYDTGRHLMSHRSQHHGSREGPGRGWGQQCESQHTVHVYLQLVLTCQSHTSPSQTCDRTLEWWCRPLYTGITWNVCDAWSIKYIYLHNMYMYCETCILSKNMPNKCICVHQ